MQALDGSLQLSASDLVGHINCRYLTHLDLQVARGALDKPILRQPGLDLLIERGRRHEQGYLEHLKARGVAISSIDGLGIDAKSVAETLAAMKAGAPAVAQAALRSGQWGGRADVLLRVEKSSQLGNWSYEIVDTKLARETKGSTILQLSLYADLLATVQGIPPETVYVVTPETDYERQPYRVADYAAYYRRARRRLEEALAFGIDDSVYPDPNPHCEVCRWREHCEDKRRADDHLSLVAGISKGQIVELAKHEVGSTAALAQMPIPLQWKPDRGSAHTYERVREQARIQVEGRSNGQVIHETVPVVPGFGLCLLPTPSPGDVFLDFEGDPFVSGGGLEFLFGYALGDEIDKVSYTADWALTRTEEKAAFERFVDLVMARLEKYPDLHIYHYAPYEPAALKRLMGRYATRENEIDHFLRTGLFVDLYAVVRHSIRASVESYSIKRLEPLYNFTRSAALTDVSQPMARLQACLELGDNAGITDQDRNVVQSYNFDDCRSARALRDWLETVRAELIAAGTEIPRPTPVTGEVSEELTERQRRVARLVERLTRGVSIEPGKRTAAEHARWLLAYTLDWHRREQKAAWWEYFRLCALSDEELLEERSALSGLAFVGPAGGTGRAPIHRYSFPLQDTEIRGGEALHSQGGEKLGSVVAISVQDRTIDIKKRRDTKSLHQTAVFAHEVVNSDVLADALLRIGEYVADNGIEGPGPYQAARDLLMLAAPRTNGVAQEVWKRRWGNRAR